MKGMFRPNLIFPVLLATLQIAGAQPRMGGSPGPKFGGALTKVFGDIKTFSAKAEVEVADAREGQPMILPMEFAVMDDKLRTETDMSAIKSGRIDARTAAQMKMMGMDKMISISRPDKKLTYVVYPGLQSYAEMPMAADESASAEAKDCKMDSTTLAKETVDGHPCEKTKMT